MLRERLLQQLALVLLVHQAAHRALQTHHRRQLLALELLGEKEIMVVTVAKYLR